MLPRGQARRGAIRGFSGSLPRTSRLNKKTPGLSPRGKGQVAGPAEHLGRHAGEHHHQGNGNGDGDGVAGAHGSAVAELAKDAPAGEQLS